MMIDYPKKERGMTQSKENQVLGELHPVTKTKSVTTNKLGPKTEPPKTDQLHAESIARPEDISYDLAYDSKRGSSFYPEKRAKQIQEDYASTVNSVYEELQKLAKTDAQKEILATEIQKFKDGYLKRQNAALGADSRTVSSMITGPAKFPTARNAKRLGTADKRWGELFDYKDKAVKSIKKKLKDQAIEDAGGPIEVMKKKLADAEKMQETMKAANKILRSKKLTDAEKVQRIIDETGLSGGTATKLLEPDYMGRKGFAQFQTTNNLANIKRMRQRVKELSEAEARSGVEPVGKKYEGAEIVNNHDLQRLQIFFDEKPGDALRAKLKGAGWRWSPREGAWQRKNTRNAEISAERVLYGEDLTPKTKTPVAETPKTYVLESN
jgi:hypothetical protein